MLVLLAGGYYIFASVFTFPKEKSSKKEKEVPYDPETDVMRPTGQQLYKYREGHIREFKKLDLKRIETESFDGLKLRAFLLEGDPKEVAICVHGYKSTMWDDFGDLSQIYINRGSTVLFVNDRAHGESEGKYLGFSEHDKRDVAKWVEKINQMYDSPRIFLHGVSMGGATVIHCADMKLENVCGIIDDCGFDSILNITKALMLDTYHVPYFPLGYFAWFWALLLNKVSFAASDGEKCVSNTDIPILFVHGRDDHFVPCSMSEALYEACASPKEIHIIDGAGHTASFMLAHDEYEDAVNRLMNGEFK